MPEKNVNASRLDQCGWSSFDPHLFLDEPGRKARDLGDPFVGLLRDFCRGTRVLELCSGAGKLLIHLAANGFDVVGIDLSSKMLEICRQEIARQDKQTQERIHLILGDICTFNLKEKFDFVILEDDCFVYLLSQEDQISCLKNVAQHLSDDGFFFISFETPERELASSEPYEYNPILQVKTTESRWAVVDEQGNHKSVKEGFERRKLTYPCELELLLKIAGLEVVHRWGDLTRSPFLNPSKQQYNYLIKKADS